MKETEERKITEKERLLALAVRNNGDYRAVQTENNHILFRKATVSDVDWALDKLEKDGYKYTTIASKDYPTAFEKMSHPPFVMFYKGNLNLLSNSFDNYLINIVGTKDGNKYIEKTTKQLIKELVKKENCTIVVGNECGVESTVAEMIIKEKGKIVIISNGESMENEIKFVIPVPKSNKKLINNGLIESGAIAVTSADEIL